MMVLRQSPAQAQQESCSPHDWAYAPDDGRRLMQLRDCRRCGRGETSGFDGVWRLRNPYDCQPRERYVPEPHA